MKKLTIWQTESREYLGLAGDLAEKAGIWQSNKGFRALAQDLNNTI